MFARFVPDSPHIMGRKKRQNKCDADTYIPRDLKSVCAESLGKCHEIK